MLDQDFKHYLLKSHAIYQLCSSKGITFFISLNKIQKLENGDKFYFFVYLPLLWDEINERIKNFKHDAGIACEGHPKNS